MKVYTRRGDKGLTGLASGELVAKNSQAVEAYGAVDELSCHLGVLRDLIPIHLGAERGGNELITKISKVQGELFYLGSVLSRASGPLFEAGSKTLEDNFNRWIGRLESEMDRWDAELPELRNFVIPGGHVCHSQAHLCRSVCRRVERRVLGAHEKRPLDLSVLAYVNRLSDWFFVCARFILLRAGKQDVLWDASSLQV